MSEALKPDDELPRSPHHVLDELKNVLSSLGQHVEPAPSFDPIKEMPLRDVAPPPVSIFPPEAPPMKYAVPPAPSAPAPLPASDADFWSGNVLGWPSGNEAMKKETAPPPPLPPPVMPPEPVSVPTPPADRPPWPLDDVLPEPPAAPLSPPKLDITPPEVQDAFIPDAFPIPRTVDKLESPMMQDNLLLQAEPVVKPKDLVQLACFFPEGNDKVGQQFAKQLRDAGTQRVPALVIEPVLISSWSSSGVDMNAWVRSAQLSGADIMFILTPRQEMKIFKNNNAGGLQPQVMTRVVATEHVALRTLYADIMIELKRRT